MVPRRRHQPVRHAQRIAVSAKDVAAPADYEELDRQEAQPAWTAQIVIARVAFRVVGGYLMFTRSILLLLYALSLMVAAPALADKGFVPLPTAAGVPSKSLFHFA